MYFVICHNFSYSIVMISIGFPYLSSECPSLGNGGALGAEEEGQRRRVRRGVAERGQVGVVVAWKE